MRINSGLVERPISDLSERKQSRTLFHFDKIPSKIQIQFELIETNRPISIFNNQSQGNKLNGCTNTVNYVTE